MSGQSKPLHHSFQDLTGSIFGALAVEQYDGKEFTMSYWLCRCLCGEFVRKRGQWLKSTVFPYCGIRCPIRRQALFLENVNRGPFCWTWEGDRDPNGYGRTYRCRLAHRIAWELFIGPIPGKLFVLHRCDNPPCINPAHLFLGTNRDNVNDMVSKDRHARGERNGHAKLTDEDVLSIRRRYDSGDADFAKLAEEFGMTKSCIRRIYVGKRWGHLK